jgi:glyoxylase-like metal-dependent hydrolase (beta-lactamase superfamily II)
MRVHHLNCGTMRPPSRRLVNGAGSLFEAGRLVCHCLVAETDAGLVLVDTGIGLTDIADPAAALGARFLRQTRPVLDPDETAIRQVSRLGYRPADVRHIVVTHLDRDHASGIADFPWATVHVHASEHQAALSPQSPREQARYRPRQWAHGPRWATYGQAGGQRWFGFESVHPLDGLTPEILLVPLPGHTRGHAGVALSTGTTWLLHAGDAYFCHGETDPDRPRSTPLLRLFQRRVQHDRLARRNNQARLRELRRAHGREVEVICAHDPTELAQGHQNRTR